MKLTAILAATLLLASSAPAAATVKVELLKESVVSDSVVRLGDVALVEAAEAAPTLRSLILCPAPQVGQSAALAAERITRRLAAVLGAGEFVLAGAASCEVRRTADLVQAGPAAAGPAGAVQALETRIRDFLQARLARAADSFRIDFDARDREPLALASDRYLFKIQSGPRDIGAGSLTLRVDICDRAKPDLILRSPTIRLTLVLIEQVLVAAHDIRSGDVLDAADLRVERREFREPPRGTLLHNAADALGATARTNLVAGQQVRLDDLAQTLFVRRGDPVTVHMRGLGFAIKTSCRALESGEMGSTIAVQGQDGSGKFYATVIGLRTVEIQASAAPPDKAAPAQPATESRERRPLGDQKAAALGRPRPALERSSK